MDQPIDILVTGWSRSGTSLTAMLIGEAGAWLGETTQFGRIRAGYEAKLLKQLINEKGDLPRLGGDMEKMGKMTRIEVLECARNHLSDFPGGIKTAWKAPSIANHAPAFHAAFPEAKWVICRRDDEDAIASNMRMRTESRSVWVKCLERWKEMFRWIETNCAGRVVEVWPEMWARHGDFSSMHRMMEFLELEDSPDLEKLVISEYWHKA